MYSILLGYIVAAIVWGIKSSSYCWGFKKATIVKSSSFGECISDSYSVYIVNAPLRTVRVCTVDLWILNLHAYGSENACLSRI